MNIHLKSVSKLYFIFTNLAAMQNTNVCIFCIFKCKTEAEMGSITSGKFLKLHICLSLGISTILVIIILGCFLKDEFYD